MPPDSARVVIVGAGIAGASVAHHLAERGWDQIVVVDQGPLWETGGSTSHAPGLVFQHNASHTMTRLAQWTVELLTALDAFHPVGSIEVATTQERWAELDRRWARARAFGLEARAARPCAGRRAAAAGRPGGDPRRPARGRRRHRQGRAGRARRCRRHDAITAFGDCEVTGLMVEGGRAAGVQTALGTIRAEHVVIAAGIWGRRVAKLAPGLNVPLVPVEHQLAYTAPLPELAGETREVVHPILRHQDHAMYFRQVRDGYAIGNYRHEPRLAEPERPAELPFTPDDFATARAEAGRAAARAARHRAHARVQRPDVVHARRLPAAGRERGRAQPLAGAGDLGHALRRLRARAGRADDPRRRAARPARVRPAALRRPRHEPQLRARRAAPRATARSTTSSTRASSHEQARGLRTTPFYERQADLGAHFFESAGWERPQWYEANRELLTGDEVLPARRVGGAPLVADHPGRAPRLPRAGRALRPHAVHQGRGQRARRAGLPAAPGGQRRRQADRRDRLHRDALAARRRSCAT